MTSYNWFNGKIIEQNIEGTILADDITADSVDSKVLKSNTGTIDITSKIDVKNNNIDNVDELNTTSINNAEAMNTEFLNVVQGLEIGVVDDEQETYGAIMMDNNYNTLEMLNVNDIDIESFEGDMIIKGNNVNISGENVNIDTELVETSKIQTDEITVELGLLFGSDEEAAIYKTPNDTLEIGITEGDINITTEDGEINLNADNVGIENLNTSTIICQIITSLYGLTIGYEDEENYAAISKFPFDDELIILNNVGDITITAEDGDVNIDADSVNIETLSLIHGQITTTPSNQYDIVNKKYVDSLTPSTQYLIYDNTNKKITDNQNVPIQNLILTTLETVGTINSGSHLSVDGRIYAENLLLSSDDTSGSPPVLNCPGYGYINKAAFDYATLTNVDNTDVNSLVNKAYVDSKISTRVKYDINIYSTLGDITSTTQPLIYQTENFNNIVKNTIYIPSSYINLNIYEPTVLQISLPASITTIPENRGFINTISVDNLSTMSNPDYTNSYYYINNKILYIKSFTRNSTVNPYKNITVIDNIEISWFTNS